MAVMTDPVAITLPANADLSAAQYSFVKLSGGNVVVCNAAGEPAMGVLDNTPNAAGQPARVVTGYVKVRAGGAITAFDPIATDASGKAKTAVKATGTVTGSNAMGIALEAATAADQIILCLIGAPTGAIPTTLA